ncbi:QsdR family transcriptional regulator [Umezawaea sp. NPDC059074]|uniref:QsdR family transcriptional regulator n=1 Tax=Umezawaea sp. NPDC059074 TaxID=3346716 RepID=UPI00369A35E6
MADQDPEQAEPGGPGRRPDAAEALRVAKRTYLAGERVDMQKLAAELGVDRTTLFRWVGNRDQLLGAVLWSVGEPALRAARDGMTKPGAQGVAEVMGRFVEGLINADSLRAFLRREPERALRLLTTKASIVQREVVAAVEDLLKQEHDRGTLTHPMDVRDLAYLVVRIAESFIYTDIITGDQPDSAKAATAVASLLGA